MHLVARLDVILINDRTESTLKTLLGSECKWRIWDKKKLAINYCASAKCTNIPRKPKMNAVYFPNLQASLIVRQIKVEIAILKDCVGLFF